MNRKTLIRYLLPVAAAIAAMTAVGGYYLLTPFSKQAETAHLYIDNDDTPDSLTEKLKPLARGHAMSALATLAHHTSLGKRVHPGHYAIEPGENTLTVFRHLKNGLQTPINLTIPSVRTMDRMAAVLGKRLMADSLELQSAFTDTKLLSSVGCDTLTLPALFIPNTYDVYWNITPKALLQRIQREHERFWNDQRQQKAKQAGLTPTEVATLASIIDEETSHDEEKARIAGMYLNRLHQDMPLQADPTVKFALRQFQLKRIYNNMLLTDSPYNTYRYPGLPPGPIRIASTAAIDAVLNAEHHSYLYMCAKEDFSGTHNFATTYDQHLQNAAKYAKALNERGIK